MEIPEKMIDSAMWHITDYFDKHPSGHHIDKKFLIKREVCGPEEVDRLIKILCENGHIKYEPPEKGEPNEIRLIDHHYFEDKRDLRKLERKETRRFWIEIVKDVVIFLLGLAVEGRFGIVQSIIERLLNQP